MTVSPVAPVAPVVPVTRVARSQPSDRSVRPASLSPALTAERVSDSASRREALAIVQQVYQQEKGWIAHADGEFPESALASSTSSWFLARLGDEAAGVVRLSYDPRLELPQAAGLVIDPGVDLARLTAAGRFVEVGRLMIASRFRARTAVVLALMRAALSEVVQRGYSHLLTVVFEDDPHSPYGFHTRVLGFERIGSHRHGELACASRRILLTLDIARAFERLRGPRAKLVQALAGGLEEEMATLGGPKTP
jgi:hypothetical protein